MGHQVLRAGSSAEVEDVCQRGESIGQSWVRYTPIIAQSAYKYWHKNITSLRGGNDEGSFVLIEIIS